MEWSVSSIIQILGLLAITCVASGQPFTLGIENVSSQLFKHVCNGLSSCRIGLITNQTGKDQCGNRNVDLFLEHGADLKYLLAPEHGIDGTILAEKSVADTTDLATGIAVESLYAGTGKKMKPQVLRNLDVLFFDLQDAGMRHFSYNGTLLRAMEEAAAEGKRFVVLDRPNPLGSLLEGPLVEPHLHSFISIAAIPLRHGMTIGELARYFNRYVLKKPVELYVVPMHGYARSGGQEAELIAPLSPNIQTRRACHGYSFLGLLGVLDEVDIGVGTEHAFEVIALAKDPGMANDQWQKLVKLLLKYGVMSESVEYYSARKKKQFRGLKITVVNIGTTQTFSLLWDTMRFFLRERKGIRFTQEAYFDKVVGTSRVRELLLSDPGVHVRDRLLQDLAQEHQLFLKKAQDVFLYHPQPIPAALATK